MNHIYCFADESGQDTKGKAFYVGVIIVDGDKKEKATGVLLSEENNSGKKLVKWGKTEVDSRISYLTSAARIIKPAGHIYYAVYHDTKEYVTLTAFTIVQAILTYTIQPVTTTIIIDGLRDTEKDAILRIIKRFHINYKKVRGLKDESDPLIRLADSIAGLVRDVDEGQAKAKKLLTTLQVRKVISEIQK